MATPWYVRQFTGRRLLWNIFFYLGHIGVFIYGWLKQSNDLRLAGLNKLRYSVWVSRGAGLCLGIDGLLLVLPVLRNIIRAFRPVVAPLVPLDENIWFHRQIAYSTLIWTIVHTTAHYVNMINVERSQVRKETAWAIMYTQPGAFTGHVMLLLMFFIYTTAHVKIRTQCFEAFWYTHHLTFFFLLGLYTHATGCFVRGALPDTPVTCLGYESWHWTIWGGIAYFIERVVREVRSRRATSLVGVLMHPSGAMELRFTKPSFRYKAGQWLFLNVPEVSAYQWHPFTISSAPDDPYVSVHIRQVGDWTQALGDRLGCTLSLAAEITRTAGRRDSMEKGENDYGDAEFIDVGGALLAAGRLPSIKVDGPFGAPAEDVFKSEVAILIGTGIGVTPFASILKNIWYMQQKRQLGALRRVHFIWCNRNTGSFEWFQTMLKKLEEAQTDPDFLCINMYLTQKMDQDMITNIAINDAGNEFDPLTNLRSRTHFGRPDFTTIFNTIRNQIELGHYLPGRESSLKTKVGVYYCGPNELAKSLREKTKAASSAQVRFSFAKEHF
ncbi:ferric reductase NAD binding domain-domain-containing protein [Leucosporidium creatinivorum]|uniref:Ferric reductase NAD binding domain-domain-containing protein n=1 Tax=Leucosporidium creatinivorum TaxID=106004 RepID=A0A1Y2G296_9BASI|nr:ferric reductase NAD binding domain-domain-containing protein [Leucosporidium creatinivorum]